jgi:lipoprotein-releasing system permease protein
MRSYTLLLARRYLAPSRRNRFISFITGIAVLGVMFGTAALLISLSILEGFDQTLRSTMIAFTGHIHVTNYPNNPPKLEGYRAMLASIPRRVPDVRAISPFVSREVIVRSKAGLDGAELKGIVPERDVSSIRRHMVSGRFDVTSADGEVPSIVIGERLAVRLRLGIGDTVIVFGPNGVPSPDNPPIVEQFVLRGTYRTGMAEYDDLFTYTSLATAQRLFDYGDDEVTGYDILVKDIRRVESVATTLTTTMGYPHFPRTVFQIFQSVFAWLDLQREPIPIVLALISLVAAFNIVSTLFMVVLEKTESIGVLSTLGSRPRGIMAIFVGQGLLIGAVGTFLGVMISLAFTWVQSTYKPFSLDAEIYFVDAVPVIFSLPHYLLVIGVSLTLCVLSTIAPAFVAARVRPVEALRFR